jgi:hypothetical protein
MAVLSDCLLATGDLHLSDPEGHHMSCTLIESFGPVHGRVQSPGSGDVIHYERQSIVSITAAVGPVQTGG